MVISKIGNFHFSFHMVPTNYLANGHFATNTNSFALNLRCVTCDNRSNLIIKNQKRSSSVEDAINYFDLMASYLDVLRNIQEIVRSNISNDVNKNITDAKYRTYIGIAIVVVVLLVSPIIIFLVKNATNTIQVRNLGANHSFLVFEIIFFETDLRVQLIRKSKRIETGKT